MNDADEADLRQSLAASRERLAALADRVARVRARLAESGDAGAAAAAAPAGVPAPGVSAPFGADARPIEDLELTFRAVDSGEGASDQDKAR